MMVWNDAKDKNVAARVFFADATNALICEDAELTVQAKEEDVLDAFLKGVLVVKVGDAFCSATKIDANVVTVDSVEYAAEAKA